MASRGRVIEHQQPEYIRATIKVTKLLKLNKLSAVINFRLNLSNEDPFQNYILIPKSLFHCTDCLVCLLNYVSIDHDFLEYKKT